VAPPPAPPSKVVACPTPALRIGIVAPRRVRANRPIRLALTVRNDSRAVPATGVVARYALPRGMVLARVPRGISLVRGQVVVRMDTLAPRASRTVRMVLRPTARQVHRRGHRAQVRERCTATRTAVTATQVQNARPGRGRPPVTG
jgi:hypothetical protein